MLGAQASTHANAAGLGPMAAARAAAAPGRGLFLLQFPDGFTGGTPRLHITHFRFINRGLCSCHFLRAWASAGGPHAGTPCNHGTPHVPYGSVEHCCCRELPAAMGNGTAGARWHRRLSGVVPAAECAAGGGGAGGGGARGAAVWGAHGVSGSRHRKARALSWPWLLGIR